MADMDFDRTWSKLQGQLPAHLARRDLAELAVLLRYAERGAWAFAIYNTVPVRDEVASVLRSLLAPLPVYEFTLSPQHPNPLAYLQDVSADQGRAVVFFFDLERTEGQAWSYLEMQRERLAARPLGLVFWINPQARAEGIRSAPNFWSQRSGVFDFTIASPVVLSEVRGAWAGQPVRLEGPEDWARQMRRLRGLLREYEVEGAPPATRAELHGKIAYLLCFANQYDESAEHLQQQLSLARAADDRAGQARALNNLGRIVQIREGRKAALDWYRCALSMAGENPSLRAESLQNLAMALIWEGDHDRAQRMLQEALELFRAVGDRLGEANTLRAIGDVQRFRDENDAALGSYGEALELFRAVGDRLGEANVLMELAGLEDERVTAQTLFNQAFVIYEAIRDRYSLARARYYYGRKLQDWGDLEAAAKQLRQSIDAFEAIGMPSAADVPRRALSQLRGESVLPSAQRQAELRDGFGSLILAVAAAAHGDEDARAAVEETFEPLQAGNWRIVAPIRRLWAGERDPDALSAGLDPNSAFLVREMLAAVADPEGYAANFQIEAGL